MESAIPLRLRCSSLFDYAGKRHAVGFKRSNLSLRTLVFPVKKALFSVHIRTDGRLKSNKEGVESDACTHSGCIEVSAVQHHDVHAALALHRPVRFGGAKHGMSCICIEGV